jgi:cellulose synthase/poly-beta-1,6-N-acetylglucosamine synthase-like glycosyltransferase
MIFLLLAALSAFVGIYVYVGYPLLLLLVGSIRRSRPLPQPVGAPRVTLLVSAFNEAQVMREKIENSLALDYPAHLEIVVVSDCSTDETDAIVLSFADRGIRLVRLPERRGKSAGLNEAIATASGELLVFSDANAFYRPDAIRRLVKPFADPEIGCVTGELCYTGIEECNVGIQEDLYWKYERVLKSWESRCGSMVGSNGAIFALRRDLFEPLQAADVNDFVIPLRVVERGFRCVYAPEAVCEEHGTREYAEEFRRKIRIVNRSAYAIRNRLALLNPLRRGFFAIQLLSHKVLRWSIGLWIAVFFVATLALASGDPRWRPVVWAQVAFYTLALAGHLAPGLRRRGGRIFSLPYYFCMVNVAAVLGGVRGLLGRVQITWKPERGEHRLPSQMPPPGRDADAAVVAPSDATREG